MTIIGKNAQTDPSLHSAGALKNLATLLASSPDHQFKQIPFPARLSPCGTGAQTPCYLTATPSAEATAYQHFLTPIPSALTPNSPPGRPLGHPGISTSGLVADAADGQSQASALGRSGLPVYHPRLILAGSSYCSSVAANCPLGIPRAGSYPRAYTIKDQHGHSYAAYRMTLMINPVLGDYYGVQGTTWKNSPLLANPTQTRLVAGKKLLLFANGGQLTTVAWRTPQGAYWISNTLTTTITNQQLVSIAASMRLGS
jgi:polyisoprenyl-teichoic acid--peptidoglycan teichoic acid transferase